MMGIKNMEPRNKDTTKLSAEIDNFIKNNSSERFSRGMHLQKAWESVASTQALKHTDNVVFSIKTKHPCVLVYVDNSHWAAELGTQKELYRLLLEKETGWEIDDLKFFVTRKAMFKKLFQKKKEEQQNETNITPLPLDEYEDRYTRELVSPIKDERLKKRLYKAMKTDFEWKKGSEGLKLPQKPSGSPEST
jgi:hypothetical protein